MHNCHADIRHFSPVPTQTFSELYPQVQKNFDKLNFPLFFAQRPLYFWAKAAALSQLFFQITKPIYLLRGENE